MSLTSYRAAPPRDKPLHAFSKNRCRNEIGPRPKAPIDPVRRLPEKATRAKAPRCERYVPTHVRFGKGRMRSFRDFMTDKIRIYRAKGRPSGRSCQKLCKSRALSRVWEGAKPAESVWTSH